MFPKGLLTRSHYAAALLLLVCARAAADTFYMKSGSEIKGTVVSENASLVVVDIGYGTVDLKKADIAKVRRATKAQKETARKELLTGKFRSGQLVPKGAEKLAGLFRAARAAREKALKAKARRAAQVAGLKETESDLTALTARYRAASRELAGTDAVEDHTEYIQVAGEMNSLADRIRAKELARDELRRQADKSDDSFQTYLDAYGALDAYLKGEGKPLAEASRSGQDEAYFSCILGDIDRMKRDFRADSIESETVSGHLIVKVLLNGRVSARLMVDTGATSTVLYGHVADALKLSPQALARTAHITMGDGRTVEAPEILLESIAVGKSVVKGTMATILPPTTGGIDGLLGMSFLSHFIVRVDSANGKLILESLK